MRAITVPRPNQSAAGFAAFLDGAQRVQIIAQDSGVPIVLGTVSAAIRIRIDRRLQTWSRFPPAFERKLYFPFAYIERKNTGGVLSYSVVDTSEPDANGVIPSQHPAALMERAVKKVQEDRERLELGLAESWCSTESTPLFIDGGISGSPAVASSSIAVGIVKSHGTLHAEGEALRAVLNLGDGERSPVFRLASRRRASVASWYLRVRSGRGKDALWGLVRVESAEAEWSTERANELSRWVLRESAPLALPDRRWDKMAYGVRDTEEFLRAIS